MCRCSILAKAAIALCLLMAAGACEFEPDIQPLVIPTLPPQPISTTGPSLNENLPAVIPASAAEAELASSISSKPVVSRGLMFGAIGFAATIAAMALSAVKKSNFPKCVFNGVLTLANAVGTLLVLTGIAIEIGLAILIINAIIQLIQFLGDLSAWLSGEMAKDHFLFKAGLNFADAIPALGVFSGIYSLMGECVFDWAIDWSSQGGK